MNPHPNKDYDGVCYTLGEEKGMSPREIIKIIKAHADTHGGQALIALGRTPKPLVRDLLTGKKLMLSAARGAYILIGTITECGDYKNGINPPEGYESPSIWADQDQKKRPAWFAIKNIKILDKGIEPGKYTSGGYKPLEETLKGYSPMAYFWENPNREN